MDITVYLPEEIGTKAKSEGLPFSRLLRAAVETELKRRDVVSATLADPQEFELDLEDDEGRPYTGRLIGTVIAEGQDVVVYVTEDERVLIHDESRSTVHQIEDAESELRELLDEEAYLEAMNALGLRPVVNI